MERVKVGFIGLGHVGQIAHFKNYLYNDKAVINGICDSRQDLIKKVGDLYAIDNYTSHADQLINDPNIEALVIVVDRGSVYSLCKKALEAKKHVFTEKPMALSTDAAIELVKIAKENQVIYKIGFMRKYDTGIRSFVSELKNFINNNSLGRLSLLRIHAFDSVSSYAGGFDSTTTNTEKKMSTDPLDQVPEWIPKDRRLDYLNTLNVYCHHLNLLHSIFDDSFTIKINYVNFQYRHCRIVSLTIEKNKKFSEIILELGHIPSIIHDEYIEASFEGGTYRVDFPPNMLRDGTAQTILNTYSSDVQSIQKRIFQYSWSFRNQAIDFIEDVQNLRYECINSGFDCIRDMAFHDKLWKQEISRSKND